MGKSTLGSEGNQVTIYYDHIESLQWFLTSPIENDEDVTAVTRSKEIPAMQRRRGPSDLTPINVSSSTAQYLFDPTLKSGNALPGKWFVLTTTKDADTQEKRRFTYTGSFHDLHAVLQADIKYPCYFRAEGSARHTIQPIIGEG